MIIIIVEESEVLFMFNDRDVICFLGDSLTAGGIAMAEIYQTVRKRANIKCYNCGVSGGTAELASLYLHRFCLAKNPTHVVIMFGANDIHMDYYSEGYTGSDKQEAIQNALRVYAEKMEYIVKECLDFGSEVILCTPVPYDEYNDGKVENKHCQCGLDACAEAVMALAKKYSLPVVDFRGEFLPLMTPLKPISPDRVHPTPFGYHVMAQIFLKSIGEIGNVDFDTPFVIEKWNQERQTVEKTVKLLDFIEFVVLYRESREKGWTVIDKIEESKRRLAEIKVNGNGNFSSYFELCYEAYINHAKKYDELIGELTKRTPRPY